MSQQPQPELVDLWRSGLKSAVDLMKVSLENAERLQNQQLNAIRTMDELLAAQTRMAGEQLERVLGYWSGLYEKQLEQARQWFKDAEAQTQEARRQKSAAR
jgi:hypothetical protein